MSTNGKGKKIIPDAFAGKEIEFPVTFQLKAVMLGTEQDADNQQKLEDVFNQFDVSFTYKNKKLSRKGAYTSYTYTITLNDRQQMDNVYEGLKQIKELKFAI
jgi:putative lipoic acid-binding regulatory protein